MQGGTGCGARGRGFAATPPGGPGSPSAPTTWGCLQWLDAAWMKGGESCLDEVSAPGSTVPGTEKPRWSAVWRTCLSQRHVNAARRWTAGCAVRRSIPSHIQGTERRASPGPRQRIRVAERWLRLFEIGCLTIESENSRAGERACTTLRSFPRRRESNTGSPLARGRAENWQSRATKAAEYGSRASLTLARDDRKNSPAPTVEKWSAR